MLRINSAIKERLAIIGMLLPVLLIIGGLFIGGLLLALVESLGYFAPLGQQSFTLKHYQAILSDREFLASLQLTFLLATTITLLSAIGGLALAVSLRELARRYRWVNIWLQIPLAVPHLAMAITVIHTIAPSGLIARLCFHLNLIATPGDFPALINDRYGIGIIISYLLKEIPFITLMVLAVLVRLGDEHELVARTLGANRWQAFRFVTLPAIAPALVSAALIVFAYLFGAFEVPFLLGRPYPAMLAVVAQRRFTSINLAERPAAIAIAMIIAVITTLLVWLYLRLARRWLGVERPVTFF